MAVEGFYEGVPELSPEMRAEFAKRGMDEAKLQADLELDALYGEEGFSFAERTGARPTLELNGVYGGFQGEGTKTVIPKEAAAKITCRLVGDQDPQDVLDNIIAPSAGAYPAGARLEIVPGEKARAFDMNPDNPFLHMRRMPTSTSTVRGRCSPRTAAGSRSSRRSRACWPRRSS